MKNALTATCMLATALAFTGCVTRTYVVTPQNRGATEGSYGAKSQEKVKDTKHIWFWQDEFRNP